MKRSLSEALAKQREAMFSELITELLLDGYKVNFSAPLGDPISYDVAGYNLMLRISEASTILIERVYE